MIDCCRRPLRLVPSWTKQGFYKLLPLFCLCVFCVCEKQAGSFR